MRTPRRGRSAACRARDRDRVHADGVGVWIVAIADDVHHGTSVPAEPARQTSTSTRRFMQTRRGAARCVPVATA
jgi:hypothetical protein